MGSSPGLEVDQVPCLNPLLVVASGKGLVQQPADADAIDHSQFVQPPGAAQCAARLGRPCNQRGKNRVAGVTLEPALEAESRKAPDERVAQEGLGQAIVRPTLWANFHHEIAQVSVSEGLSYPYAGAARQRKILLVEEPLLGKVEYGTGEAQRMVAYLRVRA